ncbi:MAG: hypothetical protein DRI97_02565 [Bacteroidetes bacterium]|nr:MAG: hypothetical protein DRI97_02565 [Bacteroidota bacterium]
MRFNPWRNILSKVERMGVIDDEDEQVRLQKSVLVVTALWIGRAALIWGLIYYLYGEYLTGSVPLSYSILTLLSFLLLKSSKYFRFFSFTQNRNPYMLETSLPGVFVAGDVRHGSIKRVASAVGEGSMAVMFVHQYLSTV